MRNTIMGIYKLIKFLKDSEVSLSKKLLFLIPIIYFIIPVDILPDYFFPIGWLDDAGVLVVVATFLKNMIDKYDLSSSEDDQKQDDEDTIDMDEDDYQLK